MPSNGALSILFRVEKLLDPLESSGDEYRHQAQLSISFDFFLRFKDASFLPP